MPEITLTTARNAVWPRHALPCGRSGMERVAVMRAEAEPGSRRYLNLTRILMGLAYGASLRTLARRRGD